MEPTSQLALTLAPLICWLILTSVTKKIEIYGKCARPNGHGHNYHIEVTVKGKLSHVLVMIVDLGALNQVISDMVLEPFDHTFLNKDIPG